MTKLYLLKNREDLFDDGPWRAIWDMNYGFVIRAESETDARQMASEEAADEGALAWLDARYSICEELVADGDSKVILIDFNAG